MAMKVWHPNKFLNLHTSAHDNYALIVLNRPIVLNMKFAIDIWNKGKLKMCSLFSFIKYFHNFSASVRVLVDGGANRWLNFLENHDKDVQTIKIPELLTGDFDSVTDEALRHFSALGTSVIDTPDQDATDYTKSLIVLQSYVYSHNVSV